MKTIFFAISTLIISINLQAQALENIDQVTPFHNGYAAIQQGDHWAFINKEGTIVINFRNDLIDLPCPHNKNGDKHPIINAELTLIKQRKNDIEYYGYINTNGDVVIEPQFINATPFNSKGYAIVHKLTRETLGENNLLKKEMIRYTYSEVVIDSTGKVIKHLLDPTHVIPNKGRFTKLYPIKSYFINDLLVALQNENKKWTIHRISSL